MVRRPTRFTRTYTLLPDTTLLGSGRVLCRRLEPYDGGLDRGVGRGGVVRGGRLGGLVLATGGEREQPGGEQGTDHVRLSCFKPAAWGSGRADTRSDQPRERTRRIGIAANPHPARARSEERRVGNEGVSTCRSRWSPEH